MSTITFDVATRIATLGDGSTIEVPEPVVTGTSTHLRAVAVALRDAGRTNAEIGALMGTTAGTAGNKVVDGLRDLGRPVESNGNGNGGGQRGPRVTSDVGAEIVSKLERAREALANVDQAEQRAADELAAFRGSVDELGLTAAILPPPDGDTDGRTPVEKVLGREVERLADRADKAHAAVGADREALTAVVAKWQSAYDALVAAGVIVVADEAPADEAPKGRSTTKK